MIARGEAQKSNATVAGPVDAEGRARCFLRHKEYEWQYQECKAQTSSNEGSRPNYDQMLCAAVVSR